MNPIQIVTRLTASSSGGGYRITRTVEEYDTSSTMVGLKRFESPWYPLEPGNIALVPHGENDIVEAKGCEAVRFAAGA